MVLFALASSFDHPPGSQPMYQYENGLYLFADDADPLHKQAVEYGARAVEYGSRIEFEPADFTLWQPPVSTP
jgi:hypothetical protein